MQKLDVCNACLVVGDCSNSSWADIEPYVIGHYKMHPLSDDMQQRLIVQYLAPIGEYQEVYFRWALIQTFCNFVSMNLLLCCNQLIDLRTALFFFQLLTHMFEHNALELIFYYIDLKKNKDIRLAFEALRVHIGLFF